MKTENDDNPRTRCRPLLAQTTYSLPTTFDKTSLHSSLVYHLVYHRSIALHVNHLIFLNSYLFGVLLCAASTGGKSGDIVCGALTGIYASYVLLLTKGYGVPYVIFVSALALSARTFRLWIDTYLDRTYVPPVVGICIVLLSFSSQLLGHRLHEEIIAAPNLFHGFVAAPVLEYMSLLLRIGILPETITRGVLIEVDALRAPSLSAHQ